jgi:hypothetical protein
MAVNVQILVIFAIPSLVMDIQQVFMVRSFYNYLDLGLAPDVLGVAGVYDIADFRTS